MTEQAVEEVFGTGDVGNGIEIALSSDTIRKRHIATRASNRRRIVVYVVGDAEFEGYSIGLDEHSLQILELPSGDVSSVALEYIVAISDGLPFSKLTPDEKEIVDRRTSSFRKTSQTWLVANWPAVYDRREDDDEHFHNRSRAVRVPYVKPPNARYGYPVKNRLGSTTHADQEVRDRAGEDRDQG